MRVLRLKYMCALGVLDIIPMAPALDLSVVLNILYGSCILDQHPVTDLPVAPLPCPPPPPQHILSPIGCWLLVADPLPSLLPAALLSHRLVCLPRPL